MNKEGADGAPSKNLWFLNGELCKPIHLSRAAGMLTVWNINREERMLVPLAEWKKKRKRAYNRADAAKILGMHRKSISRNIDKGIFPPLTGATKGGVPTFRYKSYYSEDDIKEIRNIQANRHMGRPRKDGLITNNQTPTALEMAVAMGDATQLYTKDAYGNFIPVYNETVR
ncbi:MAG: hypothetical protein VW551_04960 [Euryarchaeota archaeon]